MQATDTNAQGTDATTAPATDALPKVRTRTGAAKPKAATANAGRAKRLAGYKPTTQVLPANRVKLALAQVAKGASNTQGAAALAASGHMGKGQGCTTGQYAFACMHGGKLPNGKPIANLPYGSKGKGCPTTPGALAALVAQGKANGTSWGQLAAMYKVPEWGPGSVRAAYTAHTGQPWQLAPGAGAWRGKRS